MGKEQNVLYILLVLEYNEERQLRGENNFAHLIPSSLGE